MSSRRRQSGFSMIQLLLGITLVVMFTGGTLRIVMAQVRQGYLDEALVKARAIALVADSTQNAVTASAYDAVAGKTTYTYGPRYSVWTSAATLQTATGANIATVSPYGGNYEVRADGFPATVRFTIPADKAASIVVGAPDAFTSVNGAGDVTVTVMAMRVPESRQSERVRYTRSQVFGEEIR